MAKVRFIDEEYLVSSSSAGIHPSGEAESSGQTSMGCRSRELDAFARFLPLYCPSPNAVRQFDSVTRASPTEPVGEIASCIAVDARRRSYPRISTTGIVVLENIGKTR
jgi:hypothetical protein